MITAAVCLYFLSFVVFREREQLSAKVDCKTLMQPVITWCRRWSPGFGEGRRKKKKTFPII